MTKNQWVFAVFYLAFVVLDFLANGAMSALATSVALPVTLLYGQEIYRELES